MGNPEGHRGGLAGSCRRPTRARRHEPAAGSLAVTTATHDRLRFRTLSDAQREGAGRVMIGGVHDDLVLAGLWERRGETRMAVAARVVVLEVAAARNAGPAQEQIRIERVGLEIDGDRRAGPSLNRPRLRVRAVPGEQHVVAGKLALLRLPDFDRMPAGSSAGGPPPRRAPAVPTARIAAPPSPGRAPPARGRPTA